VPLTPGGSLPKRLPPAVFLVAVLLAGLLAGMGLVGCGPVAGLRPTPTPTRTPAAPGLPSGPSSSHGLAAGFSSEWAMLVPATPVAGFGSAFQNRLWVGLYGTPGAWGMGILGRAPVTDTLTMAKRQAIAYQQLLPDTQVVPFLHMVVTIADPIPGPRGDYMHRVSEATIQRWIDAASAQGVYTVLDIQPAHSPLTVELAFLEPFLRQPGVHLAIDPELLMVGPGDIPGERIGHMTGAQVNLVQDWLTVVARDAAERKVLIIHQFIDTMFSGKEDLVAHPLVDLVWNADGIGTPPAKSYNYHKYASEAGFQFGGFKLFYDYDMPLMSPAEVLRLVPRPVFVVYH
jgi:hypothetical protein